MDKENLKNLLDLLYLKYNYKNSDIDPIWLLHEMKSNEDIELLGFIASCYSYGRVEQIISHIKKFMKILNKQIYGFISNFDKLRDKKYCIGFNYRFNNNDDFIELISVLHKVIVKYGNLKNLFISGYNPECDTIFYALNDFSKKLNNFSKKNDSFRYLIPIPENNSTCKRLNLFLRWMVRKDKIDLGIWEKEVSRSKLIIPVDIHVYRQAINLRLVERKSCDMKFALNLTEKLKLFDPVDPVKYDFSLCHLDIQNARKSIN